MLMKYKTSRINLVYEKLKNRTMHFKVNIYQMGSVYCLTQWENAFITMD